MDGAIDLISELITINVLLINELDNIVMEGEGKGLTEDREVRGEGGHPKISTLKLLIKKVENCLYIKTEIKFKSRFY